MNTPHKSTSGPKTTADKTETAEACFPTAFATLFSKGMERAVEISKTSLDLAADQNAEIIGTCKKMMSMAPSTPGMFIFDLAGQAFESYVEMQKSALDLMAQQSAAMTEITYERGATASQISDKFTKALQESVERTVAAQKTVIEFAAKQNKVIGDTVTKQAGIAGTPFAAAAESIQRSMDAVLEVQKDMIDVATKPLKAATAKAS